MKKSLLLLLVSLFGIANATEWTLNRFDGEGNPVAEKFNVDTLRHEKVGPGTFYSLLYLKGTDNTSHMRVHFLTMDMKGHDDVEFRMELGNDSLLTTERPSDIAKRKTAPGNYYFAGVNADFYITWDPYKGNPNCACYKGGQIAMFDQDEATNYGHFFMDYNKNMWCDFPKQSWQMTKSDGTVVPISHVNHDLKANQLVMYNELGGHWTKTSDATEIRIKLVDGERWRINRPFKVQVVGAPVVGGNMHIEPGEAVLSANGSRVNDILALKDGEVLDILFETRLYNYDIKPDLKEVSGGDVVILSKNNVAYTAGRFINARDAYNPRTMFGYNEDRTKMVWGLIDGRSAASSGSTYTQGAEIMRYAGCYDAVNVDGGGSSTMYVQNLGVLNSPSDGSERAVSNGFFAVLNAPEDNTVAEIRFVDWSMNFPKYGIYTPKFYGYNQYGMLIDTDVQGVTLSCDESLGTIINDGTTFYGIGAGTHALTAHLGGMTATIPVTITENTAASLRLQNVLIDNVRQYPVEVNALVNDKLLALNPAALNWSADNQDVISIGETTGVLQGIKDGSAVVTGTIGDNSLNMNVTVEIPTADVMPILRTFPTDGWTLQQVGGTGLAVSEYENGMKLTYTGNGTSRGAYLSVAQPMTVWSLPEQLRIRINPGDATVKRVSLAAVNALGKLVTPWNATTEELPKNTETTLTLNLSDWCDPNDIAIYPIQINSLRLDMGASAKNTEFNILIPGFEAVYRTPSGGVDRISVNTLGVYPNPARIGDAVVVNTAEPANVAVYALNGIKVADIKSDGKAVLSTANLARGIYIIRSVGQSSTRTAKLIVR